MKWVSCQRLLDTNEMVFRFDKMVQVTYNILNKTADR